MDSLRLAGIAVSGGLVLIAVLLAILGGEDGAGTTPGASPRFAGADQLLELESDLGHPIYWLGERADRRIELAREPGGEVYLRYLPRGVDVGSARSYLTVGTYPVADPEVALARTAQEAGGSVHRLEGRGSLLVDPATPRSAYLVPTGEDLQIEVYGPEPGRARRLVEAGLVRSVRE